MDLLFSKLSLREARWTEDATRNIISAHLFDFHLDDAGNFGVAVSEHVVEWRAFADRQMPQDETTGHRT